MMQLEHIALYEHKWYLRMVRTFHAECPRADGETKAAYAAREQAYILRAYELSKQDTKRYVNGAFEEAIKLLHKCVSLQNIAMNRIIRHLEEHGTKQDDKQP